MKCYSLNVNICKPYFSPTSMIPLVSHIWQSYYFIEMSMNYLLQFMKISHWNFT